MSTINKLKKNKDAIQKGISWLIQNDSKINEMKDLSSSYKAPYFYAVTGIRERARKYVDLMSNKYLQKDGGFRTSINEKGWANIPSSPENRYIYSNGWIISGLKKIGTYHPVKNGLEFISRFQNPALGRFYSRFDAKNMKINKDYLDTSSTSSAGLVMLIYG
jgi:hypothetical protein